MSDDNVYQVWIQDNEEKMTRVTKMVERDGKMVVVPREWRLRDSANMWARKNLSCKYRVLRVRD